MRTELRGPVVGNYTERFDYATEATVWQRACPDCDLGLIYAPVRFCPRCGGSGYLTTEKDPAGSSSAGGGT